MSGIAGGSVVSITRDEATEPVLGSSRIPTVMASFAILSLKDMAFSAVGGIMNRGPCGRYSDAARNLATSSSVLVQQDVGIMRQYGKEVDDKTPYRGGRGWTENGGKGERTFAVAWNRGGRRLRQRGHFKHRKCVHSRVARKSQLS